jgi:hypothetical protein
LRHELKDIAIYKITAGFASGSKDYLDSLRPVVWRQNLLIFNMNVPLREWNSDTIFPELIVDHKSQITFGTFNVEDICTPKK